MPEFEIKLLEGYSGISRGGKNPRGTDPFSSSESFQKHRHTVASKGDSLVRTCSATPGLLDAQRTSPQFHPQFEKYSLLIIFLGWTDCALQGADQVGF